MCKRQFDKWWKISSAELIASSSCRRILSDAASANVSCTGAHSKSMDKEQDDDIIHTCMYVCMYMHTNTHTHTHTKTHTHTCICMYIYVCVYMYVQRERERDTHRHTQTYTHTHARWASAFRIETICYKKKTFQVAHGQS